MSQNIAPIGLPEFNWSDGQRSASLKAQYDAIAAKIDDSIRWYQKKRGPKRRLGSCLRWGAVFVGAAATALPTVSEMWGAHDKNSPEWWAHPGAVTILGIAVGVLLVLDRLDGATSGWIRYIMAETSLKELRDDFAVGYNLETANWANAAEPTVELARHALSNMHGFLWRANQIVRDETSQWKTEFQSALQQIEEIAKTASRKAEQGDAKPGAKNGKRHNGKPAKNRPAGKKKAQ